MIFFFAAIIILVTDNEVVSVCLLNNSYLDITFLNPKSIIYNQVYNIVIEKYVLFSYHF